MTRTIGIRQLRDTLSSTLEQVRGGDIVTITDRNSPFAVILPLRSVPLEDRLRLLAATGLVTWTGGKPIGLADPPVVAGAALADAVVEDRR